MNDWTAKAGDKIRRINPLVDDEPTRTVDYCGPNIVVFTTHRPAGDRQCSREAFTFYADYELVPVAFEAGKSYRRLNNETFVNCLYADDTIALIQNESGAKCLRGQDRRDEYEEVWSC